MHPKYANGWTSYSLTHKFITRTVNRLDGLKISLLDETAQTADMGVDGSISAFEIIVEGQGDQLGTAEYLVGMAHQG